ncbi:large ATP-binding protein [Streptomyces sp. NBC_01221]|uniref:large ATP-binding protein n=1 Tax=Streptomyces sp. NBC_01221 TaxID=2903782 RepID=UPI00225B8574|nr:large ATP-binding protein [Streptomyces sp. NBC_01221]MCX4785384.1 large ATP-binding protein [Streptomyces sp. NBC_01221]
MNPYDPTERPGAHLIALQFGVEDPWMLTENYSPNDPRDLVGRTVAEAARNLDVLHRELTRAARSAVELLEPISQGDHVDLRGRHGVLGATGSQVELLAARRAAAYEQLTWSMDTYRRLLPKKDTARPTKGAAHDLGRDRHDDWAAISSDRKLGALEAVEAGGLRFHQSAVYGYIYLSDGRGERPNPEVWPETIQRLVADGLLDQDTSEGLYRPRQLLSLTPQGEAALRDARTATPRVSAALSRSNSATASGTDTPAVAPATSLANKPSRSR